MNPTTHHGPSAIPSSRWRFLKQAAGTAAAFTVPNIVTGPLFAAAAPGNRITVGQIGCGSIADYYHIPIFRTLARWDVTCDYANGVKLRVW